MHSYTYYCCGEDVGKYITTADTCELKGIRCYIDYAHASLFRTKTSARMLCVILTYGIR